MYSTRQKTPGLVGRESESTEILNRIADPQVSILTITGPVGVGKSRLASVIFHEISEDFRHGGCFVDISDVCDENGLLRELSAALGLADTAPGPLRLVEHLRELHFLLVLDGCDRPRTLLTPIVARLARECPGLSVIVTGPERLGVYGEVRFGLQPLAVPTPENRTDLAAVRRLPSVQLFLQRTRLVRPNFVLTEENLEAVSQLCMRTDGLPMAIEFAAARMKLLSPQRLLRQLERSLSSLSGTEFDTLSRHRGMDDAIERFLGGLTDRERDFLTRLAPFHREFDFAAADAVSTTPAAETRELLEALVDKSVLATTECADGDLLIMMLGLTRQYLLERVAGVDGLVHIRAAHARYFLSVAERAAAGLRSPAHGKWLQEIDHWLPDITGVLHHLIGAGETVTAARIASALRLYWQAGTRIREGIGWLEACADGLPDPAVAAAAQRSLGELLLYRGELDSAEKWLTRALRGHEELGDGTGAAACLRRLALVAYGRGDLVEADRLLEECVAISWIDAAGEYAEALRDLAECRRASGDLPGARRAVDQALDIFLSAKDVCNLALTNYVQADIMLDLGDQSAAIELYQAALLQMAELKHLAGIAIGLERFAILLTHCRGRSTDTWRRAAHAFGAAGRIRAVTGRAAPATTAIQVDSLTAHARVRLGEEEAGRLAAAGAAAGPEAAVAGLLTPLDCTKFAADWQDSDSPLTQREAEVAGLVADGLTNREIARRLGIAEWTAVNHLRKIMRKLDCSSRVQVAGWVNRRAEERVAGPVE
ncbi:LuxR C-terminal-related transcriptional regulator [Streptomyces bacillaris]|nr:LuxR C-terminal-related transcriptional regulator [Streptomyces cavourensis]WAE68706.1 LuxR C-terminal-related transcriptional regulator [Streptomyces cavourensis]